MIGETKTIALAEKIDDHLRRLEADKEWNYPRYLDEDGEWKRGTREHGQLQLYRAAAWVQNGKVVIRYVSYQGNSRLEVADAERYLAKLDGGFKGRHFEALRGG